MSSFDIVFLVLTPHLHALINLINLLILREFVCQNKREQKHGVFAMRITVYESSYICVVHAKI